MIRCRFFSSASLSCYALAFSFFSAGCSSSPANAQAAPSNVTQAHPVATQNVTTAAAPTDGSYVAKRGDTTLSVARKYLPQSSLMTVAELDVAIRQANSLKGAALKPEQKLVIPTLEPQPVVEKIRPIPADADVRVIYLTGTMAGSVRGMDIVKRWHSAGGNAVVFDIKDSDGSLSVPFAHPLAPKNRPSITNLPKYVRWLHSMDMHAIARIALFRDEHIARDHSALAVHSRATGQPWLENGKLVWSDSSNNEVQDYDLALAKSVAGSGADEIQFDYVRFPAEGNQKDAHFAFDDANDKLPAGAPKLERRDVIANFLERAYAELHPMGVLLSVDVFGVMAWQRSVDTSHTGQDIVAMSQHVDVISPMIYPSHFFGMDGYAQPGDAPEHFIGESMERFRKITEGKVVLRPWLQAFAWRTKTYSPEYILAQVKTAKQRGGIGFLLWNARNDYSKPFAAMPVMMADSAQYLGKADKVVELAEHIPSKPTKKTPRVKTTAAPVAQAAPVKSVSQ
jgi:hypothetical protein